MPRGSPGASAEEEEGKGSRASGGLTRRADAQIRSVLQTIGSCIMAVISGIGGILQAIIGGIVSLCGIVVSFLTCGYCGGGGRRRGGRTRRSHV